MPDVPDPDPDVLGWKRLSLPDRERQYSPSSCVDDLLPILEQYTTRSADARAACAAAGLPVVEVRYGASESQTIDLVTPSSDGHLVPLVVFIHGGYWQELSKVESFFTAADCVSNGTAFAAIDYTLAPLASLDEIVAECTEALRALVGICGSHSIDAERIVVTGSSAGAHLAAMVGVGATGWRPAGLGLISGIFELEPLIGTTVNDAVQLDVDAAHRNSPLRADLTGLPETLVAYGANETTQFKRQSEAMAAALEAAGVEVSSIEVPERNHFDVAFDLYDGSTELGRCLIELVRRTRRDTPAQ